MSEQQRKAFEAEFDAPRAAVWGAKENEYLVRLGHETPAGRAAVMVYNAMWEAWQVSHARSVGQGPDLAAGMIPIDEQLPEMGVPVIGYNAAWIDEDFNHRGLRECFTYGDPDEPGGEWHSAKWIDGSDCYATTDDEKPTHWFPMMPSEAPQMAVPEGWQPVPKEPTNEMYIAWLEGMDSTKGCWDDVYKRMLAAAPAAPHFNREPGGA